MKYSLIIYFLLITSLSFSQYSLEWVARYAGTGSSSFDIVNDITIDCNGYIYLTGQSNKRYLTIKYDNSGNQNWINQYTNHSLASDVSYALTTDDSNNVYITGEAWVYPSLFNKDFVTIKYNSSGIQDWVRSYDNPLGRSDRSYNIEIYKNKYIYISGANSYGDSGICNFKWTTIKYDLYGNVIWQRQFCGLWGYVLGDYASTPFMSLDSNGNVIIAGVNGVYSGVNGYEVVTIKYDSAGNQQWLRNNYSTASGGIAVDANSNIYVGIDDGYIKYNSSGDSLFSHNTVPDTVPVQHLGIDSAGNLIATGSMYQNNTYKIITTKFDSSGNTLWSAETPAGYYLASSFVNRNGKTFIAARGYGNNSHRYNIFVYNNSGFLYWSGSYENPLDTLYVPDKIISDKYDHVYTSGRTYGVGAWANIITLKYSIITNSNTQISKHQEEFKLNNNYPNPFNPLTKISYTNPASQFVTLKVFDALGKEIVILVNEKQDSGSYEVDFDGEGLSSGFYFYKIEAGNFVETKRMVLLK